MPRARIHVFARQPAGGVPGGEIAAPAGMDHAPARDRRNVSQGLLGDRRPGPSPLQRGWARGRVPELRRALQERRPLQRPHASERRRGAGAVAQALLQPRSLEARGPRLPRDRSPGVAGLLAADGGRARRRRRRLRDQDGQVVLRVDMKKLSAITETFTESVIREMTRISDAAGGYNLSQGLPEFEAPRVLQDAAIAAINAEHNQYPGTVGEPQLREAISAQALSYNKIKTDPDTDITVTCRATQAQVAALMAN